MHLIYLVPALVIAGVILKGDPIGWLGKFLLWFSIPWLFLIIGGLIAGGK